MHLTERQKKILNIVKNDGPITGEAIAQRLGLTRAALRTDFTILVMGGLIDARPRVGYYYAGNTSMPILIENVMNLKVKDFKSVPIVVKDETSVYDAVVVMFIEDVGTLFVVGEEGILEGVVSRKDLLKIALGQVDIHKIPINVMMTRMPNIITASLDEPVLDAAKKIIDYQVDALPVVRTKESGPNKGKLEVVGRITKTNITKLFVELSEAK